MRRSENAAALPDCRDSWPITCLRISGLGLVFCAALFAVIVVLSWAARVSGNQALLYVSRDILGISTLAFGLPVLKTLFGTDKSWMFVLPVVFWGSILEAVYRFIAKDRRLRLRIAIISATVCIIGFAALFAVEARRPVQYSSAIQLCSFRLERFENTPGAPLLGVFTFNYWGKSDPLEFPGTFTSDGGDFMPSAIEYEVYNGKDWQEIEPKLQKLSGPGQALLPSNNYKVKINLSPLTPFAGSEVRVCIRSRDTSRFASTRFRIPQP